MVFRRSASDVFRVSESSVNPTANRTSTSEFEDHPLFGVGDGASLQHAFGLGHQKVVAGVVAEAVVRVEKPRFDAEHHALFQHFLIAECDVRKLMAFHPGPMADALVEELLDVLTL